MASCRQGLARYHQGAGSRVWCPRYTCNTRYSPTLYHAKSGCQLLWHGEESQHAWIDGQSAWAVGDWPGDAIYPAKGIGTTPNFWTYSGVTGIIGLNRGVDDPTGAAASQVYAAASALCDSNKKIVRWGPSSNHSGDVVVHLWLDAHVTTFNADDLDPSVYLRMITRSDGEPIPTIE